MHTEPVWARVAPKRGHNSRTVEQSDTVCIGSPSEPIQAVCNFQRLANLLQFGKADCFA